MRLAREGVPFFLATAAPFLAFAVLGYAVDSTVWKLVSLACGLLTVFVGYFFRDPTRISNAGSERILAPADGKIVEIEPASEAFMGGDCLRISIFLSIFNVHVQRAPITGLVDERTYDPGQYLAAWEPKASELNERAALGLLADGERVMVRQIAGLIARRIVTYPQVGDRVNRGDRIGLIRFGSRVDLFVPLHWTVLCKVGDRVQGGRTAMVDRSRPSA